MTQEQAYERLLKLAALNHWKAVYEELMKDGFMTGFDYNAQLKLWNLDSKGLLV